MTENAPLSQGQMLQSFLLGNLLVCELVTHELDE